MTQEQLRMQMLAGIITEGQYKEMLNGRMQNMILIKAMMEDGLYIAIISRTRRGRA
jgi:hypothetical protein